MTFEKTSSTIRMALGATALTLIGGAAYADQVINDDLIVTFSACIGNDCVNGESFGFDTLRLKENNLRINFADTSNSASFPTADWRIVANDTSNGGASYLAFEDTNAGRQTFRVMQGAPSNSMVLDAQGDLGLGIASAVVELHIVDGDSPTIRLEQNGSSGFTPQTFDIAANEANFFVRDVTNGSQLPFKIKPGADSNALFIAANNNIGVGTDNPGAALHIDRNAADTELRLEANGGSFITFFDATNNDSWFITKENLNDGNLEFTSFVNQANPVVAFDLSPNGDLTLAGALTTSGATCNTTPCDAVFDPAVYTVPSIEEHAAFMWDNKHLPAVGPTGADVPVNMTEKVLTMLNELEHAHIYIEQLNEELKAQKAELAALKQQVAVQ